jgi:hypothetical protein
MDEGYDDCGEMGLEEILAEEPDITDLENPDAWQDEVNQANGEVNGDLYRIHADEYLEEIEAAMDQFRGKKEIVDEPRDWQEEVTRAIDKVKLTGKDIKK